MPHKFARNFRHLNIHVFYISQLRHLIFMLSTMWVSSRALMALEFRNFGELQLELSGLPGKEDLVTGTGKLI